MELAQGIRRRVAIDASTADTFPESNPPRLVYPVRISDIQFRFRREGQVGGHGARAPAASLLPG